MAAHVQSGHSLLPLDWVLHIMM